MKEYLIENNFDWIVKEQNKNGNLSELARMKLVAALCDFMFIFFGTQSPQKPQKLTTIATALQIFPQMQSQNTSNGGVVSIILSLIFYLSNKFYDIILNFTGHIARIYR